jgi:tRNA pseudouridine13 synthase
MKIKVRPEDFQVEELIKLRLRPSGPYSIYRLEKRLWNTLDVLDFVARRYHLRDIERAGLKDRYSQSVQYISALGSGPKVIQEKNFRLRLIGHSDEPIQRDSMFGNRFRIVVRDMTLEEVRVVQANLPLVLKHGFPNYYDEQRFGSARHGEGFIAQKLILGHFGGALKLYMATPSAYDDTDTRRAKTFFKENWGNWKACLKQTKHEYAAVLRYLTLKPRDFEGGVRMIRRDLLEIFLASYQSYIWNEALSQLILSFGLKTIALPYSGGEMLFYEELSPAAARFFAQHEIPAPSPATEVENGRIDKALKLALIREGLTLSDLRLPLRIRGLFFRSFSRPGVVAARNLRLVGPARDELYSERARIELSFALPPGSFATLLVKRLGVSRDQAGAGSETTLSHQARNGPGQLLQVSRRGCVL